jgi:hypothetical protein
VLARVMAGDCIIKGDHVPLQEQKYNRVSLSVPEEEPAFNNNKQ